MIDVKIIGQFVAAVTHLLPQGPREFEKNVRAAMQGVFDRMNLVSREKLEVQEAVLARTRARLQELEKHVAELEEKLKNK